MRKYLFFFLLVSFALRAHAQKPQVVIYGNGAEAFSAAIQASSSGVTTVWITESEPTMGVITSPGKHVITGNDNLEAGIWMRFIKELFNNHALTDSAVRRLKSPINGQLARNAMYRMIDSAENLSVLSNVSITQAQRKGNKWRLQLSDRKTLKTHTLVDASETGSIQKLLEQVSTHDPKRLIPVRNLYAGSEYRTSIFCIDMNDSVFAVPFSAAATPIAENFYSTHSVYQIIKDQFNESSIPARMLLGQAIGAAAAYGAFFKTSSENINIRRLQGELLAFNGELVPFLDVPQEDVHYLPIQRIGATGLLKGITVKDTPPFLKFDPDKSVSSEEIKPTFLALFTRSQIWFMKKDIQKLTLNDLLDLVKFTALRGNEINREIERGWTTRFHFEGAYDPDMNINRRQAAVIIDHYLHPFKVNVSKTGQFVN